MAAIYAALHNEKLADAMTANDSQSPLAAVQVHLRKNWRSAKSPAVSQLAAALQNDSTDSLSLFARTDLSPQAEQHLTSADGRKLPAFIERVDLSIKDVSTACGNYTNWAERIVEAHSLEEALAYMRKSASSVHDEAAALAWNGAITSSNKSFSILARYSNGPTDTITVVP